MKLTEIQRKYISHKKYRKNTQEFIPKFFPHQVSRVIVTVTVQKSPFWGIFQKTQFWPFWVFWSFWAFWGIS